MTISRVLYALITLAALVLPVRRFILWFDAQGGSVDALIAAVQTSDLALSLTGAMVLASLATLIFIVGECVTRRDRLGLLAVPVTLVFGVAVGLPFYLFLRLRQVV